MSEQAPEGEISLKQVAEVFDQNTSPDAIAQLVAKGELTAENVATEGYDDVRNILNGGFND
jgi:hypothetical protein